MATNAGTLTHNERGYNKTAPHLNSVLEQAPATTAVVEAPCWKISDVCRLENKDSERLATLNGFVTIELE